MVDITFNGMTMEFDVVAGMMDAKLKAEVLATLNNPDEQQLLDAYMLIKQSMEKSFYRPDEIS